jgi:hypothetical protein
MSPHAGTRQNGLAFRKLETNRINQIAAGVTGWVRIKRFRFPLALPYTFFLLNCFLVQNGRAMSSHVIRAQLDDSGEPSPGRMGQGFLPAMSAKRDTGAWLVAVYKVLSQYSSDEPALDPLEAVIKAGRAADLFSAVRAAGRIDAEKFEIHRKLARIRPSDAREIIEIAKDQDYVDVTWSAQTPRTVESLEFRVNSNDSVLEAAGALFERLDPTPVALAVIQILQCTLPMPRTRDAVHNEMSALNEKTVEDALQLAAALGLVSVTDAPREARLLSLILMCSRAMQSMR